MKLLTILITLFLAVAPLSAQKLNYVLGDILVQTVEGQNIEKILPHFQYFSNTPTKLKIVKQVSKPLNIWLLHFDHTTIHDGRFKQVIAAHKNIQTVQFNHLVTLRETIPNDIFFDEQWQYINTGSNGGLAGADLDAELAWDITTGGVTVYGDTIVVAVIDNGLDMTHGDWGDNLWVNHDEIPDNGVDDDANGYVDDYHGWNISSNSDNITNGSHGTPVTAIIGAQGNNDLGVTGVNWNVKLMIVQNNFNANEASVLEAYSYPLEARMKYNESNGSEGAFVVATNASWGVNFGDPEDAPLWCAFYDTLGHAGILNCGATINEDENVDEVGDLPTTCPSDFLIAVTNIDRSDIKVQGAGFGATHIDLGAFGKDTYTATLNNSYGNFGGTSAATPHVTGAIALLYAAPCENLVALAHADPMQAALLARQYILEGVDSNNSLQGITTTEGRLNLNNSLELLIADCSPCPPPVGLDAIELTDTEASLIWTPILNPISSTLRWRALGSAFWIEEANVEPPFVLSNLLACREYEFQVEVTCDMQNSGYTDSFIFKTDGCCEAPAEISVTNINFIGATINWNSVLAAEAYNLLVSTPNENIVIENISETSYDLTGLVSCENYSVSIQTICEDDLTTYSTPVTFTTSGCGACLDFEYCEAGSEESDFEWIQSVEIGNYFNDSGNDGGYANFTDQFIQLSSINSYPVTLTPGYAGSAFQEYFKIWIDFNQDGDFDPETELAFDAEVASIQPTEGVLIIPEMAVIGLTRMRISMEWEGNTGMESPEACEIVEYGEVEDYCVNIIQGQIGDCDMAVSLDTIQVFDTAVTLNWSDETDDHIDHDLRIKKTTESDWSLHYNVSPPYEIEELASCIEYEFQVSANCVDGISESGFTNSFFFSTRCVTSVDTPSLEYNLSVYPNPFGETFNLELNLSQASEVDIQIVDITGRIVFSKILLGLSGERIININEISHLSSGIYVLIIKTKEGTLSKKIIKTL